MKKLLSLYCLCLVAVYSLNAQTNTFPSLGNVGIGTTSPQTELHLASGSGTNNVAASTISFGADVSTRTSKISGWRYSNSYQMGLQFKTYNSGDINAMTINHLGNIGIGTTNPLQKLDINEGNINILGYNSSRYLRFTEVNLQGAFINYDGTNNILKIGVNNINSTDTANDYNAINIVRANGNVGIGTISPSSKLQVEGRTSVGKTGVLNLDWTNETNWGGSANKWAGYIGFNAYRNNDDTKDNYYGNNMYTSKGVFEGSNYGFRWLFRNDSNYDSNGQHQLTEYMRLDNNGNLAIGTSTSDAKLTVKGNIHTNEVKVDLLGAVAPDYVFENDYYLKPLKEVENFITEEKHLPNIPSAKDMETDGILLKELNLKLLEKIEELTLYTIQQEKRIEHLEQENDAFKKQKERIKALEEKMALLLKKQ